jgi:hypothetical protein
MTTYKHYDNTMQSELDEAIFIAARRSANELFERADIRNTLWRDAFTAGAEEFYWMWRLWHRFSALRGESGRVEGRFRILLFDNMPFIAYSTSLNKWLHVDTDETFIEVADNPAFDYWMPAFEKPHETNVYGGQE